MCLKVGEDMGKKTYKTIDLCAGIGGIRRGFELTGSFKNVMSAEIDRNACYTYEHLYGENPFNDITSDEFKIEVTKIEYDVLLAGFPCQTFSIAGKREGFIDKVRGTLFFDISEIIAKTRPKAFLLENVDNLTRHNKGKTFATIIDVLVNDLKYKVIGVDIENDGNLIYDPKNFIRNSRFFGVPQNRSRVYIIGFDREYYGDKVDGLPNVLPEKGHKQIYKDLNEVLEMNAEDKYFLSESYLNTLESHRERHIAKGNGFGYKIVNLPEIISPVSNALLATGGSGKERNLVLDPKAGVAGKKLATKRTPLNSKNIRVMTPKEWGKLQGFVNYAFVNPKTGQDEFSFPEKMPDGSKYKQLGNSVTISVVQEMASFMKKCLKQLESD